MTAVDVTNPVPPPWYVPNHDLQACTTLVRNGNAVFWRIELTNPAWGGKTRPDWGLYLPGSGDTPEGATLYSPPPARAGLTLPGIPQHHPASPGYPQVRTGAVLVNLAASGITFKVT